MNITFAPGIQAPAPQLVAQLAEHIDAQRLDGPAFCWDEGNQVFLTVVAREGVIVSWQINPARTRAEADALTNSTLQAVAMAAAMLASVLPPSMRAALDEHFAAVQRRTPAH